MLKRSMLAALLTSVLFLSSCVSSKKYKSANAEIDRLKSANEQLLVKNNQLAEKNNQLAQQVSALTAANETAAAQFSAYQATCIATQEKYDLYMDVLRAEYHAVEEVKNKLVAGMIDFAEQGVHVYEKDGRIYVNFDDKLLYKSGSAVIGKEGKSALQALASALNGYPNLKVIVVGHTDDMKFSKGTHADNLSLSTERANGVVRVLRDENGVAATRLTAAGQGKSNPIADNSTAEGRAKNRRTEIILNPDFAAVWENAIKSNN